MTTRCRHASPVESWRMSKSDYEVAHLNAGLKVWQTVANKWQARAEARQRALDSMTIQCRDLGKQKRLLIRAMWASGIVSAALVVLLAWRW